MFIVHSDAVVRVDPGTTPNYNAGNPMMRLLDVMERVTVAAEHEFYRQESLQYLIPYDYLEMYGPSSPNENLLDPQQQDVKTDFQKQNVRDFRATDTHLVRGWVSVDDWTGPFLRLSYRGGPDSRLSEATGHRLGQSIKLWIRVAGVATPDLIVVPYNERSDRYEVELWGYPRNDLGAQLDAKGQGALVRGELQVRNDLMSGNLADFGRDGLNDRYMVEVARQNVMHPILPLHVELAWADSNAQVWDSLGGANYQYEFNMTPARLGAFPSVGLSPNPHGGIGFLTTAICCPTMGARRQCRELGRDLEPGTSTRSVAKSPPVAARISLRSTTWICISSNRIAALGCIDIGIIRKCFFMMGGRAHGHRRLEQVSRTRTLFRNPYLAVRPFRHAQRRQSPRADECHR